MKILLFLIIFFTPVYFLNLILKKIFPNEKDETFKNILFIVIYVFVLFTWLEDCCGLIFDNKPTLSYKIANYNYITYALYAYKNEQWYNVSRKTYVSREFGLFDEVKFIKGLSLMDIPFISLEEPDSVNLLDCPNKKMVKKI